MVRERPFNLKGGGGGVMFFSKKKYSDLILVEEKNKSDSEFLSYNLMLNSEEKKIALCATIKKNILTLVLSEKKILNETKNHTPPPSS